MNLFEQQMEQMAEINGFIDSKQWIKTRQDFFSPVRLDAAAAATLPAAGAVQILFERQAAAAMLWGSGLGGVIIDDLDFNEWFILNNRSMPEKKYFIAEFFSLAWNPLRSIASTAGANTLNLRFADNKNAILHSDSWVEIRPNSKDVSLKWRLDCFGDRMMDEPRTTDMTAAAGTNLSSAMSHYGHTFGGRIPLFPDTKTPGIIFSPREVIDIRWHIVNALPVIVSETPFRFNFEGWLIIPL